MTATFIVATDLSPRSDRALRRAVRLARTHDARLILLGDRYQLASVEAGSVLAEVCGAAGVNHFSAAQCAAFAPLLGDARPAAGPPPLADHVVTLRTSHRFHAGSPIGRLAAAVNAGDAEAALRTRAESDPTVQLLVSPRQDLDAMHGALFARSNVTRLQLPFLGAALQTQLIEMGILVKLLELAGNDALTPAAFFRLYRARRDNGTYLRALMSRLDAGERPFLNMLLCRNVTRRMNAPRFRRRLDQLEEEARTGAFAAPSPAA